MSSDTVTVDAVERYHVIVLFRQEVMRCQRYASGVESDFTLIRFLKNKESRRCKVDSMSSFQKYSHCHSYSTDFESHTADHAALMWYPTVYHAKRRGWEGVRASYLPEKKEVVDGGQRENHGAAA